MTLIFFNCSTPINSNIQNNIILKKYFSKEEIIQLGKIVSFFDKKILKHCKSNDTAKCYFSYFKGLNMSYLSNGLSMDTMNNQIFLNTLPKDVFNAIWEYTEGFERKKPKGKEYKRTFLMFEDKKYYKFLGEYAESNTAIKKYYSKISDCGSIDLTCGANNYLINNYDKFDFKNEIHRLIFSIHYITVGRNNMLKQFK